MKYLSRKDKQDLLKKLEQLENASFDEYLKIVSSWELDYSPKPFSDTNSFDPDFYSLDPSLFDD